ncbi:MAG: hypothetical protein R3A79_13970 [Nannocystaceae bacterium]
MPALARRLALVACGLLCAACHTWPEVNLRAVMVEAEAASPCQDLEREARERGWYLVVSDGGFFSHTQVLAADETWVLRGGVLRIRSGGWLPLRKQWARDFRVALTCPPHWTPIELPVHMCRTPRGRRGVIDPGPLRALGKLGHLDDPCRLAGEVRVGREWIPWGRYVIVRPSPRASIEGPG